MNDKNKGILFIILSALSFAIMSTFVKLSGDIPSIQKSFFRNFVSLIFAAILLIKSKAGFKFKKSNLSLLILRSLFGTLGILCNYYAIEHLILADASIINKLSPFFVIIFSYFILKEKIKLNQILAILVSFIGSIFIINPNLILNIPNIITGNFFVNSSINTLPAIIGFIGAMSAGVAYTMIRFLTIKGEKGPFIVFFFSAFSCLATLPYVIFKFTPMVFTQFLYLMLAGVFAAFGQFAITKAYSKAPAREISIFDYSQIIFSAIIGFIVFGQVPNKYSFIGYIIVCSSAIFMFVINNKSSNKKAV